MLDFNCAKIRQHYDKPNYLLIARARARARAHTHTHTFMSKSPLSKIETLSKKGLVNTFRVANFR